MNCKQLKEILETLPDEAQIAVEVLECGTNNHIAKSYDIGFNVPDGELKFTICIERP